jgi:hypothetical protein
MSVYPAMSSSVSADGPSIIWRFVPEYRTRNPFELQKALEMKLLRPDMLQITEV